MIADDKLQILAQKYQTTELNVRREYMQHLFLSYLYRQRQANQIFFKGGTALKILYKSPRFSEDLDFSSPLKDYRPIEQALVQTLSQIEKEGIASNLKEAKTTSGGYLARILFKAYEQSIEVLLQISLRDKNMKSELLTIANDFIPTYAVMALTCEQLAMEKIQALLTRQKSRDFYDLYFILRANLLPPQKKAILSQVLKTLKLTNLNFEYELKQFLPKSHWPLLKNFKGTLEREIQRFH